MKEFKVCFEIGMFYTKDIIGVKDFKQLVFMFKSVVFGYAIFLSSLCDVQFHDVIILFICIGFSSSIFEIKQLHGSLKVF